MVAKMKVRRLFDKHGVDVSASFASALDAGVTQETQAKAEEYANKEDVRLPWRNAGVERS